MTFAVTENGQKVLTMAEYIEREALLREIERREALMVGDKLVSVDAMKSFIKNRPAADVVEVVRCKDCKNLVNTTINANCFLICDISDMEIAPEDFCSHGERREE